MKLINKIVIVLIFFLLTSPLVFSFGSAEIPNGNPNILIIKVAQYPRYAGCDELFDVIFHYSWESNGTIYSFNLTELTLDEISGKGEKPLKVENFDLLLTGATFDSFYKHGANKELLNNIRNFVSNGGGYQSVCAGTVFSTQGYENPDKIYKKYINNNALKIANVYLNLNLFGEAQYIFKMGAKSGALVPIENKVVKNSSNPIFKNYPQDVINISYGGGPGLYPADNNDPKYGKITPLLVINEELMETKPIHWYRKGIIPGWVPFKKVKTDFKGQYGAIASTYGKGRIVIFNCHPEITLVVNGTIDEYVGKPSGYGFGQITIPPLRVVFSWTGTPMNMSRNWWIHRRAAAWVAGVPDEDLPPCNELMVFMDKPQFRLGHRFYFNDSLDLIRPALKVLEKIISWAGMTVIVGDITVEAYAENSNVVEFYVDGQLEHTDNCRPFRWTLDRNNFNGVHHLELRAYDEFGNYVCDGSDFFFINT